MTDKKEYCPTMDELIKHVDAHAIEHYPDGWDEWIECLDYSEKVKILEGCIAYKEARLEAAKVVKEQLKYAAIRAENCGLWDTGEDSKTEFYNQIQVNAEKSVQQLAKKGNTNDTVNQDT